MKTREEVKNLLEKLVKDINNSFKESGLPKSVVDASYYDGYMQLMFMFNTKRIDACSEDTKDYDKFETYDFEELSNRVIDEESCAKVLEVVNNTIKEVSANLEKDKDYLKKFEEQNFIEIYGDLSILEGEEF